MSGVHDVIYFSDMSKYLEILKNKGVIIMDGGMGTLIQGYNLTFDDYDGLEGLNEMLNITHPEIIGEIHNKYLEAGSMAIETNSFGASRIKLAEYSKENDTYKINYLAAQIAKNAVKNRHSNKPAFVIGTMGPTGKLPSSTDAFLGDISFDELEDVFYEQAKALIDGGVDVLLLETQHDILEVKAGILGCKKAINEACKEIALQVQVTIDAQGNMLYGTNILEAFNIVKDLGIDVFGINCSTGPLEMEKSLKRLSESSQIPLSVLPNAGMPCNEHGHAVYKLEPEVFAQQVKNFIKDYGVQVIGGCCGTRPAHIEALAKTLGDAPKATGRLSASADTHHILRDFASPIGGLGEAKNKAVYIIGERINSQGSKKAKELMIKDEYNSLLGLAKDQESKGADLLDLCFAMNERSDEKEQMSTFINLAAYATKCPLVFDSTEPEVLEAALKRYAGRAMINSINLESDKYKAVLPLVKKYATSTIALCINEKGMAKTKEEKLEIARKIYNIATKEYCLKPYQLIFDPLTFTLATGEDEYRNSAIETFEAIKEIKEHFPGVRTVLGVSNISFGLNPAARKVLNLVYLNKAVDYGLDFAIFNAEHYFDINKLSEIEISLAESLIFNKEPKALINFIEYYQDKKNIIIPNQSEKKLLPIENQLQNQIIDRNREGIISLLEQAMEKYNPVEIINTILLPAMKVVGGKMETGEIILPFVLESADIMRTAIAYLEKFLDKDTNLHKGTIILATVFGDVHDIGKNLVKTITANNGYKVIDLGKQVPADLIIETAIKEKAQAITLSALLVTTSKQMQLVVEKLHHLGKDIPVIIGGAATNERFAENIALVNGTKYAGKVYYAKDAFAGLKILDQLIDG